MKEKRSAFDLARVLAVLGGLLTIVSGAQEILSLTGRSNSPNLELVTRAFVYGMIVTTFGLVGVVGSKRVRNVPWSILLIISGLIAYQFVGGFPWLVGPVLIVLAGIVGVVAKLA